MKQYLLLFFVLLMLGVVSAENLSSVEVVSVTPTNGSVFVMGDSIPNRVNVEYEGVIDFNKSNLSLLHNGEEVPWISFGTPRSNLSLFWFQFSEIPDGVYSGSWLFVSADNVSSSYDYEFTVRRSAPPRVVNIRPGRGVYTTEEVVLSAELPANQGFVLQWIVSDGLPSAGSSGWRSLLESTPGVFSGDVNFGNLDSGAIYLKVIDDLGNYRIQPSGLVSSDVLNLNIEASRISVFPGHLAEFDFVVSRKDVSMRLLRCRLSNFVSDDVFGDVFMAERASVVLGNNRMSLKSEYEETLTIGGVVNVRPRLVVDVPVGMEPGVYSSELECLVTG